MSQPVRIAVIVRRGQVESVYTFGIPVDVTLIDFDAQHGDDGVEPVPGGWGDGSEPAYIQTFMADPIPPDLLTWSEAGQADASGT